MNKKLLFLVTILNIFLAGCTTFNPATGKKELILISTSEELMMGKSFHQELMSKEKISTDGAQTQRLVRVGQKIARVSDRQDYQYEFYLIESDELNAFTSFGGKVYMYTGLMKLLKTDDQLAGVLAHEIGHGAAKHTVKKLQKAMGYSLVGSLALSQLEGASRDIANVSVGALMNVVFSANSRQDEFEADRLAVKYVRRAGYDPQGIIEMFGLLQKEEKKAQMPLILRSHPYMADRIKAVELEINKPVIDQPQKTNIKIN